MTSAVRRKQQDQASPESPEALTISALVELGSFKLSDYRVSVEDFGCYEQLVNWCVAHQDATGRAPSLSLVRRKWPDFEITADVDPWWAAGELRRASANRAMRVRARTMLEALDDNDVEAAYASMEGLTPPMGARQPPLDGFDATGIEEDGIALYTVPWQALQRVVGGWYPAELWYLAARPGIGKSNICTSYITKVLHEGGHVAYWSCEMPAAQVNRRIRRTLSARDLPLQRRLEGDDRHDRKMALDELKERIPGTFHTYDPSSGRITLEAVRDSLRDYDFVVVDHAGLLQTGVGARAIDDWRVMATISNRLREETLASKTPCLALAQINREGDSASPRRTPKLSELSQADALGQDGTVVIMLQRFSKSVMLHETRKVREGSEAKWFTRYDPAHGNYEQISLAQAEQIAGIDEDHDAMQ